MTPPRFCAACEEAISGRGPTCEREDCRARFAAWSREATPAPSPSRRATSRRQPNPGSVTCRRCGVFCRPTPARPDTCYACHRRPPVPQRPCARCGASFKPVRHNHVYCTAVCAIPARPKTAAKTVSDRLPCASCAYSRPSRDSSIGWECGIEAAMRCRPYGAATLYVRREQGESAC